jgi:RNA polymerase sigma-70 factor (ECF subfamily)
MPEPARLRADELRTAADRLGRSSEVTGFRRKTALDNTPESDRLVARAVARAKEGDRDAIRYLYLRFSDNVYGYVRSIVRDDHEAEDITQHVFAKLITHIHKYEPRGVPFSSWILRLARNVAIDGLRSRRSIPTEEVFGEGDRPVEAGADHATSLRAALASLPEDQRKVVVMRHVVGLSPAEIAERLDRTESSVHGLHHRGRKALQDELVRLGAAPGRVAA